MGCVSYAMVLEFELNYWFGRNHSMSMYVFQAIPWQAPRKAMTRPLTLKYIKTGVKIINAVFLM